MKPITVVLSLDASGKFTAKVNETALKMDEDEDLWFVAHFLDKLWVNTTHSADDEEALNSLDKMANFLHGTCK